MTGKGQATVFRVGLTGGIASGKSTVAAMFAENGVPVIDTDQIARSLVEPGEPALAEIVAEFGELVLTPARLLDRARLREIVFSDDIKRRRLESILHPRIRERTLEVAESAGGPYQIIVVPLLLESGFDRLVDRVLVVDCPREVQVQRLLKRDRESEAGAARMINAQFSRDERLARADDVVDNSGDPAAVRAQVAQLHHRYSGLARGQKP